MEFFERAVLMSAAAAASPSPPSRPSPKPDPARTFQKLLRINYDVHNPAPEYRPPDHSYGETWPGKQRPSTQLTLFSVGVKKRGS